jgi:hypothetical protein
MERGKRKDLPTGLVMDHMVDYQVLLSHDCLLPLEFV